MEVFQRLIEYYERPDERVPYLEWFNSLQSGPDKDVIRARLARVRLGNLGDCKPVGEGVLELRIHLGPGYRIYFAEIGRMVILLLTAGDKDDQRRDILQAKSYWAEFRRRL